MKFTSKLSTKTFICSELKVRDYKELLKCSYGEEPNKVVFTEVLCEILSHITKESPEDIQKLSILDLFCLILDIRINSQGNACDVIITNKDKKMNLELKLDHIKTDLSALFDSMTHAITHNGTTITIGIPSLNRLIEETDDECAPFIKSVSFKKTFNIDTNEQAALLIERLPSRIYIQIREEIERLNDKISQVNLLSRYKIKDQSLVFVPSLDFLIWFTKLVFNESIETFYSNLFYLSHLGHLDANYIENSVVGEYNYFVRCLHKVLAEANSSSEGNGIENNIDTI